MHDALNEILNAAAAADNCFRGDTFSTLLEWHCSTQTVSQWIHWNRAVPDLFCSNPAGAEPDFQIDCNFANLMCKTLRTYKWLEFLIIFCAAVTVETFWISYLFRPTRLSYYSSKLSNVWEKSTFQIQQNYPAPVGFLPDPDFCRVWKKCRILAGTGAKIRYSPTLKLICMDVLCQHVLKSTELMTCAHPRSWSDSGVEFDVHCANGITSHLFDR